MKLEIDKRADACYITLKDKLVKPLKTHELTDGVMVDYDGNDEVYGIEFLETPEINYLGEPDDESTAD